MAADNPLESKAVQRELAVLEAIRANQSALLARQQMARQLGSQFKGARNVYEAAGYPELDDIPYIRYEGKYYREGVGTRVVEIPVTYTWKTPPEVRDTAVDEEPSDFVKAWASLTSIEEIGDDLDDPVTLWSYIVQADILAGIGRYGGLLVGINDGLPLDQPLQKANSGRELLYLTPLSESDMQIKVWGTDSEDRRYGLPVMYGVDLNDTAGMRDVHWTRVVHIAERGLVYGRPRMERVFNYLEDLLKITAGSGESAWKLMWKGIVISAREGYRMPDDGSELTDKAYEYIHDLTRVLEVDGADVQVQGGEIVDPSSVIRILIALVSAATSIPQRLLLGSERGELASTQDETNWLDVIQTRRETFAEPIILRRLINRLIYGGVLPMPRDRRYTIQWPNPFSLTRLEQADVNLKRAQTISALVPGAADLLLDTDEIRVLAGFDPRQSDSNLGVGDEDTAI